VDSKKAGPHSHASVVILNEQNWDHYVPQGKEVDAIYGDAVLKNAYLTAVIANPVATRNANMTVRNVGGSLIDLTSNSDSSDQLSCFYPLQRAYVFDILKTQQSQSETIVNGQKTSASQAEVLVEAKVAKNGVKVTQVYCLNSDDRFLTLVTRFVNTSEKKVEVNLAEDLRADGGKENMVYRPNGVGPMHWFADQFWGQAYAIIPETGWSVRSTSNSRTHQLVYQRENNPDGKVEIAASGTFEFLRKIYPGKDLVEVQSHLALDRGVALHPVELAVKNAAGDSVAHAMVNIVGVEGINGNSRSDSHGHVNLSLPAGTFRIKAEVQGQKLLENEPATIEVAKNHHSDQRFHLPLAMWKPGAVQARFTDESGNPIACKVEFVGINGTASPYFGPETAEFGVMNLRYAPHGQFDQELAAGDYEVIVSHGAEYNAIFKKIKIDAGVKTRLEGKLVRSVQTPGWISADYHSHSSPSGDNTGSQLGRVLNLVAEHIEFAPCTEHNRIETYEPEIAELKIQHAIATVSGMEMTGSPLPLNHQNVFPLIYKPRTQDGGGPTADPDPTTQILRLLNWDNRSEKLIQQNHPDIGWLFYDKNGDQKPDGGYSGSLGVIDVMEIHPIDMVTTFKPTALENGRESTNQMFAWLQLLNQGYRIPGVVNTDAHYNFHGSGGLRNWVQSSTDDPAKIDPMEMVRASEQGRVIMSNGPYLEFQVRESGKEKVAVSGEDLSAPSKKIRVSLRVQCPDWTDINRVFLLVNGRVLSSHDYRKTNQADKFQSGTVKFEQEFDISLEQDAHLIAVAVGEGLKLGPVMGPAWGQQMPAVVANPIFVDVDGNGFSPNKDTLGYPLPVKFVAK
ncbi:MAG: hypothetical protein RJA81_632, partial [Planctomycetota bacterium]